MFHGFVDASGLGCRFVQDALAVCLQTVDALGPAAAFGGGIGKRRREVTLLFQPIQCDVDRSRVHQLVSRQLLHPGVNRNAVGLVVQCDDGCQYELFEITLTYKRLVRMAQVTTEIRDRLPEPANPLLTRLEEAVASLAALVTSHASAAGRVRELTRIKKAARTVLRSSLDAIQRTAQAIAVHTPELDPGKFRNPRADQALLTAARSAAPDAAPLAEAFIAHAIPPDFLESLETSIGDFQQAREEYASAKRASHYKGEQIEAMTQEAREVAKRLDAIVRNALSGDGATFAVWERACQFGRSRSRRPVVTEVAGAGGGPKSQHPCRHRRR